MLIRWLLASLVTLCLACSVAANEPPPISDNPIAVRFDGTPPGGVFLPKYTYKTEYLPLPDEVDMPQDAMVCCKRGGSASCANGACANGTCSPAACAASGSACQCSPAASTPTQTQVTYTAYGGSTCEGGACGSPRRGLFGRFR